MNQKGFTLIELLVVVAIIGIVSVIGVVSFQNFTKQSKDNIVLANCDSIAKFIEVNLYNCSLNPNSSLPLMSIGGHSTIENVPCNRDQTPTGQMVYVKMTNHLNNSGFDNPYGNIGGHTGMVQGGGGVCQGDTGDCNSLDVLMGNGVPSYSIGRAIIQTEDSGEIALTCFYEPGERPNSALKWTTPRRMIDPR